MTSAGDDGDGRDESFVTGGKADGAISDGSPEAVGVLAVVNTLSTTALDVDVGLDSRAAKNITAHRDGATTSPADDDPFDTLAELDAIPYVGPSAFAKLLAYARAHGFVAATGSTIALPDSATQAQTFGCRVASAGTVECWGRSWDGTSTDVTPRTIPGLTGVTSVTAGGSFVVALAGGKMYWWGSDSFVNIHSASPVAIAGASNVEAITTGSEHACALRADGTVSCWGSNFDGPLGDGTKTSRSAPTTVPGLANIIAISAGGYHTCALSNAGEVSCWGDNTYHQVDNSIGSEAAVLSPRLVPDLSGVTAIAAGGVHTCALKSNGDVVCWGGIYQASGNDGDFLPIRELDHVVKISAGYAHTCALESTGAVACWGWGGLGQLGLSTAGCAFDENGLCALDQGFGRVVPEVSNAVEISAKGGGSCARTADDHVTCWGSLAESLGGSLFETW